MFDIVLNEDTSTCSGLLPPILFNILFLQYPTYFIELIVIGSINSTLLSKLYKYRVSRRSHDPGAEYMLCCCYYKKWHEVLFCVIGLIATLLPVVLILVKMQQTPSELLFDFPYLIVMGILSLTLPIVFIIDLVLTVISLIALVTWICKLKRRNLVQNKMKLICKEISLVIGFMSAFLAGVVTIIVLSIFSGLIPVLSDPGVSLDNVYSTVTAINTTLPLFLGIAPLLFLLYICISAHKPRQETQRLPTTTIFTAPPSTRVSLPTDTAAHAPNLLSPSTAEPTEETSLIKN